LPNRGSCNTRAFKTSLTFAGRRSGALYYVVAVAAGGAIYLRVFRGWKLVDMMYVTRSSLKKSVGQLSDGGSAKLHYGFMFTRTLFDSTILGSTLVWRKA